jgi:hypothetical protein
MNERERMLAEGPRVAPEASTVSGTGSVVEPAKQKVVGTKRKGFSYYRLIPVVAFGGFLLAQSTGFGKYAFGIFVAAAVVSMLFRSRMLSR